MQNRAWLLTMSVSFYGGEKTFILLDKIKAKNLSVFMIQMKPVIWRKMETSL